MKRLFCIVAWVLVAALSGAALSGQALADFTFIHASDTHFGAGTNHDTNAKLFAEIAALKQKPAFVVATGDIAEYGTYEEYALYREAVKSLSGIPLYTTTGNHDVRWNPRGKEGYTLGTGRPLYESWTHENVHFVSLDSTVLLEHWGHISKESLRWLAEDLKKVGQEMPVVIGFHHWIGRESIQVDNEQELLEVVRPYNVVLWLQGHGHSDIDWNINGTPATMVKGLYQGSYNIIDVTDTEMRISKRFVPDPKAKQTQELTRDKSTPADPLAGETRHLMTIPLKRREPPSWEATAALSASELVISAKGPDGAKLAYRVNTDKPVEFAGDLRVTTANMSPGKHVVTVILTLADGRAYQKPLEVVVPGNAPVWAADLKSEVQSRVVRFENLLLVSTMGTDLVALNAASGSEVYRVTTGGPIFTATVVDGATAYFGSADHHVYAIDARTGARKWKTKTGGAVLAGPAVAKGVVCVGSVDTKIYGLDAATGSILWTVAGGNMFQSAAGTDGERFFVGGWDNHFRCIEVATGKQLWALELGRKQRFKNFSAFAPAITAPAAGGGKVFISTNDGILHGLKADEGTKLWQIDWKKMGYSSPLYRDGRVYGALADEGKVFAVNADTGEMIWTTDTGAVIYDSSFCYGGDAAPAGHGGVVFIGNVNGTLNALQAETGKMLWQYRLGPGHLLGSPAADEQTVYVGSMNGQVVALPIGWGRP